MSESYTPIAVSILLFFGIALLAHWIARERGFFWLPLPSKEKRAYATSEVTFSFLIFFIGHFALFPAVAYFAKHLLKALLLLDTIPKEVFLYGCNAVAMFLTLFILFVYLASRSRTTLHHALKESNTTESSLLKDAGMGLVTWLIAFPTVAFVSHFVSLIVVSLFQHWGQPQDAILVLKQAKGFPIAMSLIGFSIVFLAPMMEELLFRGILQRWLVKRMERGNAIVITSVLFALLHFTWNQGIGNLTLIPTLFTLSLYLGFIFERQRSLIAPFALHALFNGVSVIRIFLG